MTFNNLQLVDYTQLCELANFLFCLIICADFCDLFQAGRGRVAGGNWVAVAIDLSYGPTDG